MDTDALMKFRSHVAGRNADVEILSDRVEWSVAGRRKGTEMIPVKAISSVNTKKEGFTQWKVIVTANTTTIEFRVDKATAEQAKELLTQLVTGSHPTQQSVALAPPPPAPASTGTVADELLKLKQLADAGVLSAAEFDAAKARLLGQ